MLNAEVRSKRTEDISLTLGLPNHKWLYMVDCGYASGISIQEYKRIRGVFISHTHIDHFVDFDSVLRHSIDVPDKIVVCGPKGITHNVQSKFQSYTWNLIASSPLIYEVHEIVEDGKVLVSELRLPDWEREEKYSYEGRTVFENSEFFVDYALLDHKIPTVAYCFQQQTKARLEGFPFVPGKWARELKTAYLSGQEDREIDVNGVVMKAGELFQYVRKLPGYKLGVVMDHKPSPENHDKIVALCEGADELFIESYYRHVDYEFALKNYHSTARISGELARRAGVKKLHPIHHSRRYNQETEDLLEECMAAFEGREPNFKEAPIARY